MTTDMLSSVGRTSRGAAWECWRADRMDRTSAIALRDERAFDQLVVAQAVVTAHVEHSQMALAGLTDVPPTVKGSNDPAGAAA